LIMTSFLQFAQICQQIESTSGSLDKTDLLAFFLAELAEDELAIVPSFVMGSVFPASSEMLLGVGPSTLYEALSKATGCSPSEIVELLRRTGDIGLVAAEVVEKRKQPTFATFLGSDQLSVYDVYLRFRNLAQSSGKNSQNVKMKNLQFLFSESTPLEALYISRLVLMDMRIGVGEGIVRDAIAKAFHQPVDLVERGYNLSNDLGLVSKKAKADTLSDITIVLNRPIKMMLAQIGGDVSSSLGDMGSTAVEWKFDGSRVQIHKTGDDVQIYSRRLENVTRSLPEIVDTIKENIQAESAILDGEVVAIGEDGRPRAFQEILRRFRRKYKVERLAAKIPLKIFLFDLIYLNGQNFIDEPLAKRRAFLEEIADPEIIATQVITNDQNVVDQIYQDALDAGHEGVMLKNPNSTYLPGKRGKNWLKIKPVMETLDLVVIGARWGEGRRAKLLGSYRLACRELETGNMLDVGWVATGITDDMLAELTNLFADLMVTEAGEGMMVNIRPEVIFEVAYEEIQKSPNYSSGYALRFPRLVRVRDDKSLDDADSLDRLTSLYTSQRGRG